jgi:hypothetical protein
MSVPWVVGSVPSVGYGVSAPVVQTDRIPSLYLEGDRGSSPLRVPKMHIVILPNSKALTTVPKTRFRAAEYPYYRASNLYFLAGFKMELMRGWPRVKT